MRIARSSALRAALASLALAFTLVAISGCNTVKGVGRDIEAVGERTQDAIQDN